MGHQGAAHKAGTVKVHIGDKAPGACKNEDQDNSKNRDGTAHRSNQATHVVDSGQPTEADQGHAKDRPIPRATGKQDPARGLISGSMGMGGVVLSMGANGEALKRPTWASRGILYVIMFTSCSTKSRKCMPVWWVLMHQGSFPSCGR